MFGQNSNSQSANFVGHIPICCSPVSSGNNQVDQALGHEVGCHIVGDQSHIDPGLLQFPTGKASTLQERSGFIGINAERHLVLMSHVHRWSCCAKLGGCQGSSVAVRKNALARLYQLGAMDSYHATQFTVLFVNPNRFLQQKVVKLSAVGWRLAFCKIDHTFEAPFQIDCCWSGLTQPSCLFFNLSHDKRSALGV